HLARGGRGGPRPGDRRARVRGGRLLRRAERLLHLVPRDRAARVARFPAAPQGAAHGARGRAGRARRAAGEGGAADRAAPRAEDEAQAVCVHIAACAHCRRYLTVGKSLEAAIRGTAGPRARERPRGPRTRALAAVAALAIVAALVVSLDALRSWREARARADS